MVWQAWYGGARQGGLRLGVVRHGSAGMAWHVQVR